MATVQFSLPLKLTCSSSLIFSLSCLMQDFDSFSQWRRSARCLVSLTTFSASFSPPWSPDDEVLDVLLDWKVMGADKMDCMEDFKDFLSRPSLPLHFVYNSCICYRQLHSRMTDSLCLFSSITKGGQLFLHKDGSRHFMTFMKKHPTLSN